jgi:hypothetical protein
MLEGAHPMMTGFFRLKDRTSRRASFPVEGRLRFGWRRLRETTALLRGYARVYLEMQDLWLQTRIRRDDYAFLGDLRQLASKSMQDVKVNWARVHATVAERLVSARTPRAGAPAEPSPFYERLDAVRQALGARATGFEVSLSSAGRSVRARTDSLQASFSSAGRSVSARKAALQAQLADLRLRCLPPLRQPSWTGRAASRLNMFSMRRLRPRPELHEYWEQTWESARRLQFWRVNPLKASWRLARDSREALIFLFAMWSEKY